MLFIVVLLLLAFFVDVRLAVGLIALTAVGWVLTQFQRRGF